MPIKLGTFESHLRYITIIIGLSAVSLMNVLQYKRSSILRTLYSVTRFFCFFYCLSVERVNNAQVLNI